jgi:hypothetical protein
MLQSSESSRRLSGSLFRMSEYVKQINCLKMFLKMFYDDRFSSQMNFSYVINPITGLESSRGFQEVEVPRF